MDTDIEDEFVRICTLIGELKNAYSCFSPEEIDDSIERAEETISNIVSAIAQAQERLNPIRSYLVHADIVQHGGHEAVSYCELALIIGQDVAETSSRLIAARKAKMANSKEMAKAILATDREWRQINTVTLAKLIQQELRAAQKADEQKRLIEAVESQELQALREQAMQRLANSGIRLRSDRRSPEPDAGDSNSDYSRFIDSKEFTSFLKVNKRGRSPRSVNRWKHNVGAVSQAGTHHQSFKVNLTMIRELGMEYPPEWESKVRA